MLTVLYILCFPNGKHYVGITDQSVSARLRQHRRSRLPVGHAIRHFWPSVAAQVLACGTRPEMAELERFLISDRKTQVDQQGYNVTEGGDGTTSEDARKMWLDPRIRQNRIAGMRGKVRPVRFCSPLRKLSRAQVAEVRERLRRGERQSEIARRFDVVPAVICNIKKGRTYAHP